MTHNKPFVDTIADLVAKDVIRAFLAVALVLSTIALAACNALSDSMLVLTTAVVTFYFGTKNGISEERVNQMLNCPLGYTVPAQDTHYEEENPNG